MEPRRLKKNEKYNILICAKCFKHEHKGKMLETPNLDDAIYDMIEQRFKNARHVELFVPEHKKNPGVMVEAEAIVDEFIVPITILYTVCSNCSRAFSQAYNGIMQLRNPTDEIYKYVKTEMRKAVAKNVHCIKEEKVTNGYDFKFTDAQFTRNLGRKMQNVFGGELVETARLVTKSKETSKDLYRVTVLFRYPKFKKGDIVSYKGREVKVINIGKKVYVIDIKSNKKDQINYNLIE